MEGRGEWVGRRGGGTRDAGGWTSRVGLGMDADNVRGIGVVVVGRRDVTLMGGLCLHTIQGAYLAACAYFVVPFSLVVSLGFEALLLLFCFIFIFIFIALGRACYVRFAVLRLLGCILYRIYYLLHTPRSLGRYTSSYLVPTHGFIPHGFSSFTTVALRDSRVPRALFNHGGPANP
ncbi:hypothetical protein P153DRAFT_178423 [Dothidotthia symphoricarpi CBS 119687]|uniref:Uncharacterized protein n=1 Tax=Dothidotthia symphoricarpi CBS 119687 TaxID=1392245 RepID=A0A6A6AQ10_9PLEO|nr:uncharacterized protein P153DRAFT_178423 [Dothidotthia symphoricarpi CBS 119687]KAF2133034.1 hypothetical protein P153DRAFT_178423 [Dothidotthia symphoricarpi CBS 119687]